MSIEILPQSQLSFHRPFTQLVKEIIIVRNPNHEPVSFKIKTTAPKQYCVRPNMGRIEPNQSVEIQIILQPMKEDPPIDFKCKDKFMIQSIGIIPEHEPLSLEELWAITSKDLINEKKLRCEYLPPVGNNPFPTLTSPIHSHNIAEPFRNDDDDPAKLRRQLLEAKDEITRLNNMIENYKQELNTTQMRQRKDEEAAASFEKLSNYYLKLLNDKEDFNVIINVGMSPDIKIFQAHSNILRNRSLYFRKELARISKDENNIKTINLKNVSIQQFEIIIK